MRATMSLLRSGFEITAVTFPDGSFGDFFNTIRHKRSFVEQEY
jgi:hypothetical protein